MSCGSKGPARSRGTSRRTLDVPVSTVSGERPPLAARAPRHGLAARALVELGVPNALAQRLLQIVQKPVAQEDPGRVAPLHKPIQHALVDGHAMIPLDPAP